MTLALPLENASMGPTQKCVNLGVALMQNYGVALHSRAAAQLDELLEAWRSRELGAYRYIVLDAQYEKVRQGGQVLDAAVLLACGVGADGQRDVLGCSVSLSEAEVHWRQFLAGLKDRGLHGIELIVSDAHEGLQAARKAVFPSVPCA